MEIILCLAIVIVVVSAILSTNTRHNNESALSSKGSKYKYYARKNIMTNREKEFFVRLNRIFGEHCYVLSQIQLSNLLNHAVKGQNFRGAFAHINGKSVDYVLIRKSDLTTLCAIELDDSTHDKEHRQIRDAEVDRMFKAARQPLVHIRNDNAMSDQDIINAVRDAINSLL